MEILLGSIRITPWVVVLLAACSWGDMPPPNMPPPPLPPGPGGPPTCRQGVHVWNGYHFGHDNLRPVVVNISSYTLDLAAWNIEGSPIFLRATGEGFTITVRDGGDAGSGWLGLASVWVDANGHILRAEVTMNTALLARYGPRVAAHVLAQELGHLMGLDHQRGADDSAMDDCQGRGSGWLACLDSVEGMTPNAHDFEQLRQIYEHVTGDLTPPACTGQMVVHSFGATDLGGDHVHP